jgi:hypothetical protein
MEGGRPRRSLRALALFLASAGAAHAAYSWWPGYVPVGDDVGAPLPSGTTVAAAEAACTAAPACAAFTYEGPKAGPSAGPVYLKNSSGWAQFAENATSPWSTYARAFGPCDLFAAGGTPCVAAHSVVRSLYADFAGALYAVNRSSDGAVLNISTGLAGIADAAAQDAFCAGTYCFVQTIFDQSERRNHLGLGPPGGAYNKEDLGVNASRLPFSIQGERAYAAYFEGAQGYRIDNTSGVATGNDEETLYMVTSGTHVNGGCCFDYGNAEVDNHDDGAGTMEAVYWGTCPWWGKGLGSGPWVMADLENGLWAGSDRVNPDNVPLTYEYVVAMVKGGSNGFALKAADATQGKLMLMYDGPRPDGYQPMKKQGAIILGIGGDNSDSAIGTFYEGCITSGLSSDATDDAVQANIVAARYGQ